MLGLVQAHETGPRDSKPDHQPEALVLDRTIEFDACGLEFGDCALDVVAHEVELVVTARGPRL